MLSSTSDVTNAFSSIYRTASDLKDMREDIDGTYRKISSSVQNDLEPKKNEDSLENPNKRQRNLPSTFNDCIVCFAVDHITVLSHAASNPTSLHFLLIDGLDNTIGKTEKGLGEQKFFYPLHHFYHPVRNFFPSKAAKSFVDVSQWFPKGRQLPWTR